MANTIITKNSATASAVPTSGDLVQGELAVNVTDKRLFTENSGGTVVEVGTNPSTIAVAGNATVGGTLGVTGLATLASSTLTANPTLTSGTANGVTYLNGSKVLASGSALTFDGTSAQIGDSLSGADGSRLYIYGNLPASTQLGIKIGGNANSYAQQAIRFYDTYFGAYAGFIGFTTNSLTFGQSTTESMRLTSTGLGIGTSSPAYKLHAYTNSASPSQIAVESASANVNAEFIAKSTTATWRMGTNIGLTGGQWEVYGGSTPSSKMILDSAGNLGLGVTPSAGTSGKVFQITNAGHFMASGSNVYIDANAYFDSGWKYITTAAASNYYQSSGAHIWNTAPSGTAGAAISFTQAMTLDASGNLGVGATSPTTKLTVYGPTTGNVATFSNTVDADFYINCTSGVTKIGPTSGVLAFQSGSTTERLRIDSSGNVSLNGMANGRMGFASGNTAGGVKIQAFTAAGNANGYLAFEGYSSEYGRFDSSGNLLVGTTTQTARLNVTGSSSNRFGIDVDVTARNIGDEYGLRTYLGVNNTTSGYHLYGTTGGTLKYYVNGSGSYGSATNSYGSTSDVKVKENIVDATPKLADLMKVRIRNFNLISDEFKTKQIGVIAQELEQVFPGLVEESPDHDAEGNDLGTTTKSVKYSVFVPMLIKAMQEQQAIIESLTARVSALEGN